VPLLCIAAGASANAGVAMLPIYVILSVTASPSVFRLISGLTLKHFQVRDVNMNKTKLDMFQALQ